MAYSAITKPTDYFDTVLYTGNGASTPGGSGSTQTISSLNFAPDWVWIKDRGQSGHDNCLADTVRAAPNLLVSNSSVAQITDSSDGFTAFTSSGFTLGDNGTGTQSLELNKSGNTFVSWNWAAGGSASSNSDGSVSSSVSANATSGFSIVTWTGTGATATIGHGLGAAPKMIIIKSVTGASGWRVYHDGIGATKALVLETTAAADTATDYFNDTAPTSSVFTVKANSTNDNTATMIAYCFAEKQGYSKFGSYTGNNNADGTFVHTGFKPAFVIIKTTTTTEDWGILDNKRSTSGANVIDDFLYANQNLAESSAQTPADFLSNGFKLRNTDSKFNSANTYIYMAFAENPFVGNDSGTAVPGTAR